MLTQVAQAGGVVVPPPHPALVPFIAAVRRAVNVATDPADTAQRVAAALRVEPPPACVVPASGPYAGPRGQRLYIDAQGSFSIIGLRWRPAQRTRVHDHISWGAVGVIAGLERETMFDADLNPLEHTHYPAGAATWFVPPGDIHQVHNVATTTSVSIHVFGADLRKVNSSVRRYYQQRPTATSRTQP